MTEEMRPSEEEIGKENAEFVAKETGYDELSESEQHVRLSREESEQQLADFFGYIDENVLPIMQSVTEIIGRPKEVGDEEIVNNTAKTLKELAENSPGFPQDEELQRIALGKVEQRTKELYPAFKLTKEWKVGPDELASITNLKPELIKDLLPGIIREMGSNDAQDRKDGIRLEGLREIDVDTAKAMRRALEDRKLLDRLDWYKHTNFVLNEDLLENLSEEDRRKIIEAGGERVIFA